MAALIAAAGVGCGKGATVEEAKVARASPAAHERIQQAQDELREAELGLSRAEAAVEEAKKFKEIAEGEHSVAEEQVSVAADARSLGRATRDPGLATAAESRRSAARAARSAAESKVRFGEALVNLREEQKDAAEAKVELAKAKYETAKFEAAKEAGTAGDMERKDFMDQERAKTQEFEKQEREVRSAEAISETTHAEWVEKRKEADEAMGDAPRVNPDPPGYPTLERGE